MHPALYPIDSSPEFFFCFIFFYFYSDIFALIKTKWPKSINNETRGDNDFQTYRTRLCFKDLEIKLLWSYLLIYRIHINIPLFAYTHWQTNTHACTYTNIHTLRTHTLTHKFGIIQWCYKHIGTSNRSSPGVRYWRAWVWYIICTDQTGGIPQEYARQTWRPMLRSAKQDIPTR